MNDRLIEVIYPDKTTTYTYDAAYNRETELTKEGTTAMDGGSAENGGRNSLPENTERENKVYVYNNRNQLTQVTDNLDPAQTAMYS